MPLLPFQSGCESQIQTVRTHTCVLAVSVNSHTTTSLPYTRAVLPSVVHPLVPFLAFQSYRGHTTQFVELHVDVSTPVNRRATQTSVTVVSKFPTKENLGSHACTNSGYQALFSDFF